MEPCPHEKRFETIERRHESISESIKKMEDKFDAKLDMILFQINKVAILEEKHSYQSAALERAFTRIQILDASVDQLNSFKDKTEGMAKMAWIIWGGLGLTVAGIVAKLFGS